jgi:hypothetical protein
VSEFPPSTPDHTGDGTEGKSMTESHGVTGGFSDGQDSAAGPGYSGAINPDMDVQS